MALQEKHILSENPRLPIMKNSLRTARVQSKKTSSSQVRAALSMVPALPPAAAHLQNLFIFLPGLLAGEQSHIRSPHEYFCAGNLCPEYAIFLAQRGMRSWVSDLSVLALEDKTCNAAFASFFQICRKVTAQFCAGVCSLNSLEQHKGITQRGEGGEHPSIVS